MDAIIDAQPRHLLPTVGPVVPDIHRRRSHGAFPRQHHRRPPFFPIYPTLPLHRLTNTSQGPFLTSKHLSRSLHASPWGGRILNISSDAASLSTNTGGNLPHRLSKAALNQLTATIAAEGSRPSLFEDDYLLPPADDSSPAGHHHHGTVIGAGNILANGAGAGALTAISVHPGHADYREREEMERCVAGIATLVERLCESDDGSKRGRGGGRELEAGGFYRWDGRKLAY